MNENFKLTYNVDLVFCIDSTGSMSNIINIVKQNALNLYADICRIMEEKHKVIDKMRVRVISFRDYLADGENAMMTSDFFDLPEQAEDLKGCVDYIEADGGGDIPEDGLEALAYAIRSPWNSEGMKKRHVIVLWSDAPTHELGHGKKAANYPANMAKSFEELSLWWGDIQTGGHMDQRAKRLLIFTPNVPEWSRIAAEWNNVIMVTTTAEGLTDVVYEEVLAGICNTI